MGIGDGWDSDEVTGHREWSEAWMPDTCYVLRNAGTVNAMRAREHAWGTVGTTLCRIRETTSAAGSIEAERQGAVVSDSEWEIVLPYATDVERTDRLIVAGTTYDVVAMLEARTKLADLRVRAVRRD
jgi:head-tail adaptor